METKANNVLVGLFFIILLIGAFVFVYWIARFDVMTDRRTVHVVFRGPVTGLKAGNEVLFNGIDVGRVVDLYIDPNDSTAIRAVLKIDRATPLKVDTEARLEYQALTGVARVQILSGSKDAPPLSVGGDDDIAVLMVEGRQFSDLMDAGRELASQMSMILNKFDSVVQGTSKMIDQNVRNVEVFTNRLASNADRMDGMFVNITLLSERMNDMSLDLMKLINSVRDLIENGDGNILKDIGQAARTIDSIIAENRSSVGKSISNMEKITGVLSGHMDGVDVLIGNFEEFSMDLKSISGRLEAFSAQIDHIDGEEGGSVFEEARLAVFEFRKLAQDIDQHVKLTTENVARFTGRGFREFESFVVEGRAALRDMRRMLSRFERDPQDFFFGGSRIQEYPAD